MTLIPKDTHNGFISMWVILKQTKQLGLISSISQKRIHPLDMAWSQLFFLWWIIKQQKLVGSKEEIMSVTSKTRLLKNKIFQVNLVTIHYLLHILSDTLMILYILQWTILIPLQNQFSTLIMLWMSWIKMKYIFKKRYYVIRYHKLLCLCLP